MNTFSDAAATLNDIETWLIPDVTDESDAIRVDGDVRELNLKKAALNQSVFAVKASLSSALAQNEHSGSSALAQRWRGHVISQYVRGTRVFDGPIEAWSGSWQGRMEPGGTQGLPGSHISTIALNWFPALMRRRVVKTTTGARFEATDTPNRIFCQLIRESAVAGSVVTPAISGSNGWQVGSETRDDFGGITVACALPTAAGTSVTWRVDVNTNLLDALIELCNAMPSDEDWLWPTESRSGSTVTFGVLRGRSGGSRQIGTDRTTAASGLIGGAAISAERGNLVSYDFEGDRVNKSNHVEVLGKGRGAGQNRRYGALAANIVIDGIYEDTSLAPHAADADELDHEGQRFLNDRANGEERAKYGVVEIPGAVWPDDLDLADTIPIYTPLGESVEETIVGVEWDLVAPGPARLKLDIGAWPVPAARDLNRAGGGSRGGRGGGGRARNKNGESETDPDEIKAFLDIDTDDGNTVSADVYNDTLALGESSSNTPANVKTDGADDPEVIGIYLELAVEDPTDETLQKIAPVLGDDAGTYYVRLYQKTAPDGP